MPEETKPQVETKSQVDSADFYNNTIKEIIESDGYETNSRTETEATEEPAEESKEEKDKKEPGKEKEAEKPTEKGQIKSTDGEEKDTEILGKTPKEIEELINQKTQEAVKKHESTLKDYYESEKNELVVNTRIGQIEQVLRDYEVSVAQIDEMFKKGEITPEVYKNAINQAIVDVNELRQNHSELQKTSKQASIPKIKRINNESYQKMQEDMLELKDPIVKKYADNLKEKIYDAGGIDLAKGGFACYVRDFIASAVAEAEIRGYQKIKNELEKDNAKAKAKAATQPGDSVQTKTSIRTADDIQNASKEDWLKFVLN